MWTKTWFSAGALAVLVACSGSKGGSSSSPSASSAGVPWIAERAQGGDRVERAVAQRATGAQAGTVREVSDELIVLDPYESWAGDARIALEKNTPVFRGDDRLSERVTDVVRPGLQVNVYYGEKEGAPVAMGIKILSTEEAERLRDAISQRTRPSGESRSGTASRGDASNASDSAPFGAAPSQSGRIGSVTGDELVLEPYEASAGDARLQIDRDVQVMRSGERVGREALRRGEDVRVFFEPGGSTGDVLSGSKSGRGRDELRVIGIEILSDAEAERIRESSR
jgi:hypothetical protein